MLVDNMELQAIMKTQSAISDERSLMHDIDVLLRQHPNVALVDNHLNPPTPQEGKKILYSEPSQNSLKKAEVYSPSEDKFQKRKKPFEFAKKMNLEIDINTLNEENDAGNFKYVFVFKNLLDHTNTAGINLDLSQMRLALGSEQLIREQSARTLSQNISTPTYNIIHENDF